MRNLVSVILILLSILVYSQTDSLKIDFSQIEQTETYYKEVVRKNKKSNIGNYTLANVYLLKKDYPQAIQYANKLIKSKSEYSKDGWSILGTSYDALGNTDKAIKTLEKAQVLYPQHSIIFLNCAFYCYKNRYFEKSINNIVTAIQLQPNNQLAYFLFAIINYEYENNPIYYSALMYGLMLNPKSDESKLAIQLLTLLLEYKHEWIQTPNKENRINLHNTNDLLTRMILTKDKKNVETNFKIDDFIFNLEKNKTYILKGIDNKKYDTLPLVKFFNSLYNNQQSLVFYHYIAQATDNKTLEIWFKNHSKEIQSFANWLEINLKN